MKRLFLVLSTLMLLSACGRDAVRVTGLSAEMLTDPVALGTAVPRLGWRLEAGQNDVYQESYRILVASDPSLLKAGEADLWDSGEVESDESLYIPYAGKALGSRAQAWWKVLSRTNKGLAESPVARFGIGLLAPEDWSAAWIGHTEGDEHLDKHTRVTARYFRKEAELDGKVASARLYICGLGSYEAYINGKAIGGDAVLKPALADYHKTVYYSSYDVTDALRSGRNAFGVVVGGGRFTSIRINPVENPPIPTITHYGLPQLLFQLELTYADGRTQTVCSDSTWKVTARGPIRTNNEYDGEVYDARLEMPGWDREGFDDSAWHDAATVPAPGGLLTAQPNPDIRIQDTVKPVSIRPCGEGWLLDMGQNMVGWLQFRTAGLKAGDAVRLQFVEVLDAGGNPYLANLRGAETRDTYIAAGPGKVCWHPSFVYHGFRYVIVEGLAGEPSLDDFEGQVFYDAMPTTGSFSSSDPVMNQVYRNAFWGIRGNYRSMPTDCPQRDERMGWLGDRTTGCYGESLIFGNNLLYSKWLQDIEEAQLPSGSLPDIAPNYWYVYTDNMTWPAAFLTGSDMLLRRFGDASAIVRHYPAMKKWLLYMKEHYLVDGILTKDTYGDWCMPPESPELIHSQDPARITDRALLSTAFYVRLSRMMAGFAPIAGYPQDAAFFSAEADASARAFNARWWNETEGCYDNNTVTANILALFYGITPAENRERVFGHIVSKTLSDLDGHVSVGVVGIQQLMRCLTDNGRGDIALHLATDDTYPSWGYMAAHGATTIWELWNGDTADPAMNSANHVMILGDLITWEYEYLAGIRPLKPGYKEIELKPYPLEGLDHINCSYESVYGRIGSNWRRDGDRFLWDVVIPANTSAAVLLPGRADPDALAALGATFIAATGDRTSFRLPSGKYHLESTL